MRRSLLILASLFASCLLTSCHGLDRYQMMVSGPLEGFSPSADDHVVYRLNTQTGEIEYLMEVPVLTDTRDNTPSPHFAWQKIYISPEWRSK